MSSVILSGTSGWLGQELLSLLNPKQVICIHRTPLVGNNPAQRLVADLSKENAVKSLLHQFSHATAVPDIFIHCAGLAHQPTETKEIKEAMWRVNDLGTANALEFCQRIGIKRFIYVSTIAGYDWSSRLPAREEDELHPTTEYAKSKLNAEQRVLSSPMDVRVVRLATVFGKGDPANFSRLAQALRRKRFPLPGQAMARKSVIPINTAARLILKYATMNLVPHKVINLALPEAPCLSEICDSFSNNCNFPPSSRIPLFVMRILAKMGDCIGHIRKAPFNSEVLRKLTTSTWVDTTRMQETFPDEPFEDFNSGLKRHADYYRNLQS